MDAFEYVASFTCNYLFSRSGLVTHAAFIGLLFTIARRSKLGFRNLIWTAVKHELVKFTLWILTPFEWLFVFLTLWYFLKKLEENDYVIAADVSPRVDRLYKKTCFISDFNLDHWFKSSPPGAASSPMKDLAVSTDPHTGHQRIDSSLQCLRQEDVNSAKPDDSYAIELNSIKSISQGCQLVLQSDTKYDIQPDRCISLECGQEAEIVVLIVDSSSACTEWLATLRQITGIQAENVEKLWLHKLVNAEWLHTAGDSSSSSSTSSSSSLKVSSSTLERNFGIDEAYSVLQKAKKNVDRNYLTELFKTIAKPSSSSGGGKTKSSDVKLNIEEFVILFKQTAVTSHIQTIFNRLRGNTSVKTSVTAKTFMNFVLSQQKEHVTLERVISWIVDCEPVLTFGNLSVAGFSNYLTADENSIFNRDHRHTYHDMTQPLCHYFIATSHNTYLTKDQLRSKSSVEAYITAFKRGCKCVELDCWDGTNNEPVIYHGRTLTSKILFKDVIQAVKDYAFCVSPYPVILSFENHCSIEQQKVMATHLKTILGSMLHTEAIPEDQTCLPSPEDLKGYVLVKAKKYRPDDPDDFDDVDDDFSDEEEITVDEIHSFAAAAERKKEAYDDLSDTISINSHELDDDDEITSIQSSSAAAADKKRSVRLKSLMQTVHSVDIFKKQKKDEKKDEKKEETVKVVKIAQELSDLVSYCQATAFRGFEYAKQNCKHHQMSSFGEKKVMKFTRESPISLLQYNQRQLSRTYPGGVRVDSSNYDPLPMWTAGCQLVALNYQTACREMQLNQGLFQDNGGCGYVLKPQFMREETIKFDPRHLSPDVYTLTMKIIYGHQIPYKTDKLIKSDRSLMIQIRTAGGVEANNQLQRTSSVKNNGYYPVWDDELQFKLHTPDLVLVNISVYTKESFVAQFTLPFSSLMQGYRKVPLQNKFSEPISNAYLMAHIAIQSPI